MTGSLVVGIDPGRYEHGVVAVGPGGEIVLRERIANEAAAMEGLIDRVTGSAGGPGRGLWVIEADGGDGVVFIGTLLARDELVATLTPTEVAARRKGRRQVHKSDLIDAELCAKIGREEQATLRRLVAVPEAVAEMRVLARYQEGLIRDRTRLINRLRFLLSQYWPEFLAAQAFKALDGDAVTALLGEFPTPTAMRVMSPLELAGFLGAQRYRRRPLERAEQLLAAAQVRPRPQEDVYGRLVAEVAVELRALKARIAALDEEISDRFLLQPEALPVRPDGPKEGVLVARGFTADGERVLLDVCLGQRERLEDWLDLGRGLSARGLRSPLLVVADGAPGLIRAIGELWPDADRQRCSVHRLRNILAKLPKRDDLHERVRAAYWAALDGATSPTEAETGLRVLVGELERKYPSAAACLAEDLPALTVHLAYPSRLKRRLRSPNLLERSLEEVRRRTKVIGRFPGETSCLTLAWAVMDLVIAGAKGLGLTLSERHAIAVIVAERAAPRTERQVA